MSSRASSIAKPNDSPYYIGFEKVSRDPYDAITNPDGIIQLGLSENRVSSDLQLVLLFVVLGGFLDCFEVFLGGYSCRLI